MVDPTYVLCYDLGTTANKSCLYSITDKIELIDSFLSEYPLIECPDGGVEQRFEDWWASVCKGTKELLTRTKISPNLIKGIAFCCQIQSTIMVDEKGKPLHNPMIWLDCRSTKQIDAILHKGFKVSGMNAAKLLKSIKITGAIAGTAKDPLYKYLWLKENRPEIIAKAHKWIDVPGALVAKCTGKIADTYDCAHLTWIYNTNPGQYGWSKPLCDTYGVDMKHLPDVVASTDIVGTLLPEVAKEMGLVGGIPVFGGGGDASLIPLGSGCVEKYDTHIYVGTSGWVVSNINERKVDIGNFIGSVMGAIPGFYNYIGEQETAGVCLQWVRDHLALDEIGLYLKKQNIVEEEKKFDSLYDFMNSIVLQTPPGANGVIFTPWLHGNRSPREDPYCRGMFFNLDLNTGKKQLIRAVLEGVAFHMRWMLECIEKLVPHRDSIRYIGGGAKSDVWCQIMADVTGRKIETIANTQNAGTIGAAMVCAVGLKLIPTFQDTKKLIPVKKVFEPRTEYKKIYDHLFSVFIDLYENNKNSFKKMNSTNLFSDKACKE